MAVRDDLIEALSDSIDRLNDGEELEAILASYPDLANQLRPMIEAGLLFPRARFAPADVNAAQEAIEPAIQQTIRTVFGGWNSSLFGLLFAVAIGVGLVLAATLLNPSNNTASLEIDTTVLETDILLTSTSTIAVTDTMPTESNIILTTVTLTVPIQPVATENVNTVTSTMTSIPSTTTPTEILSTVTRSPTTAPEPLVVIQGPIEAITADTITIFDQTIDVLPDDPMLQVMQIGDIVRIEGERTNQAFISLIEVNFINVTVVVFNGEVWRGDDCGIPPPEWAENDATEWLIACTSNQSQSNNSTNPPQNNSTNSSSGRSSNNNDDDDGGDDDD